jgi:hypothetical protein
MQREEPSKMAARAIAEGTNVMAVVNGDFDSPPNYLGVSTGPSITSGQLWTAGIGKNRPVLALLQSGEPVIGLPVVSIELRAGTKSWKIAGLNKPPGALTEPLLYTRDFRANVKWDKPVRAVVIGNLSSELPLRADSEVTGTVSRILEGVTEISPETSLVVVEPESVSSDSPSRSLKPGRQVRLKIGVTVDSRSGVRDVIGGFPVIVRDRRREIVGDPGENLRKRHPRTAACYNDSEVIFTVVDGRQPQLSVGMTLEELADLMVSLGCKVAMNTDGGGSSVMAVAPPPESPASVQAFGLRIVNSPSDGKERGRGNAWIVVADPVTTGKSADSVSPGKFNAAAPN